MRRKELAIEPQRRRRHGDARSSGEEEAERPVLSDDEVRRIAALGVRIEAHYGAPQDTEWAIDAAGAVWMLQSRPVTAAGGKKPGARRPPTTGARSWCAGSARPRASRAGRCASSPPSSGAAELAEGEVLVTHMTAPDWVPLMRRAAAIVTDSGGMTCHAAIVSRELGIPCVVGTAEATRVLRDGELVTVDAGGRHRERGRRGAPARRPGPGRGRSR